MSQQVEIPDRALFKASEVCDLVKVQPYVLRSWEAEFKDLGVARGSSTTRVYRREDIERVLRIKHLLLIEGLTLAGVRRKLEEEAEPPLDAAPLSAAAPLTADARNRIGAVKRNLQLLLDLLDAPLAVTAGGGGSQGEFELAPLEGPPVVSGSEKRSAVRDRGVASDRPKSSSPRRKRSA
ncbi:MAG TPA: MerR family transcriptional regulator [Vicinamibacterales bacterium]|nr:MerR family transcriptional regulator [Vicinamibacterales bacterium]